MLTFRIYLTDNAFFRAPLLVRIFPQDVRCALRNQDLSYREPGKDLRSATQAAPGPRWNDKGTALAGSAPIHFDYRRDLGLRLLTAPASYHYSNLRDVLALISAYHGWPIRMLTGQ